MKKKFNLKKLSIKEIQTMDEKTKLKFIENYNNMIDKLEQKQDMIDLLNFEITKLKEITSYFNK